MVAASDNVSLNKNHRTGTRNIIGDYLSATRNFSHDATIPATCEVIIACHQLSQCVLVITFRFSIELTHQASRDDLHALDDFRRQNLLSGGRASSMALGYGRRAICKLGHSHSFRQRSMQRPNEKQM